VRRPNHSEIALKSFERFLLRLATIPDPRRAEGKLYQLPHVLLFSILAIVSGANLRWLRLSEQFPANDKWRSAGFRSFDGAGCWV